MKKVRVFSSWTSEENIKKRLISQYLTSETDISNIQFVEDDSYDIVVFFGYINKSIKDNCEVLLFPAEPIWSGGHQKTFNPHNGLKVFGYDIKNYPQKEYIVESTCMPLYGGRGPETEGGWDFWNYENLVDNKFEKTKGISSIVSNLNNHHSYNEINSIYHKRYELMKYLIDETDFIDIYSWESNNINVKGWLHRKEFGLSDYKFSLAIENSHEKNWISEKFYDCILTNTIPIYYGVSNLRDIHPEDGYILLDNIDDKEYVLSELKNIQNNLDEIYQKKIEGLLKIKQRLFNELNPLKLINSY